MARRFHQTMADYLVIAITPALIMLLVGSLVFFLLGVFYQGEFQERLHWVMTCFVFGAVLIARISIEEGFERAAPFGAALAIVVGIAANHFMAYHGGWIDHFSWIINWSLIALVWWCAHRLTWDCTVIDDSQDASGQGLLETAGLEKSGPAPQHDRLEGTTSRAKRVGWWQRYLEHQRRPHAPGVWVVYFSLAALPLFGIGQWLIPENDAGGRTRAFWLLTVYVASGMGLLLTTSFLGLRRYLRQRRIEMPALMTNVWLGTGSIVIVLILMAAALLPRPSAEYAISQLPFTVGSPEQFASSKAPLSREGTKDDRGRPASDEHSDTGPRSVDSTADDHRAPASQQAGSPSSSGQGSKPSDNAQTSSSSQANSKRSEVSSSDSKSADQKDRSQVSDSREPSPGKADGAESKADRIETKRSDDRRGDFKAQPKRAENARTENSDRSSDSAQSTAEAETSSERSVPRADAPNDRQLADESTVDFMLLVARWAFYAAFAIAVLYAVWSYRAEILAALRDMIAAWRDFWRGLFGAKKPRVAGLASEMPPDLPQAPFSSYADPFVTGIASRCSAEELIRYSFQAFEAWSAEHGCPRLADRTPHELAHDVGRQHDFIRQEARGLAELYAVVAYARSGLPRDTANQLERLWRQMRAHVAAESWTAN